MHDRQEQDNVMNTGVRWNEGLSAQSNILDLV